MDGCVVAPADCDTAGTELVVRRTTGGVCLVSCAASVKSDLGLYLFSIRKNSSRLNGLAENNCKFKEFVRSGHGYLPKNPSIPAWK